MKKADYNGPGVYAIINAENMRCYVGSSTNIKNRIATHKAQLNAGKHPNKGLNADREKPLVFVVLEDAERGTGLEDLQIIEVYYMLSMMQAGFKLYNDIPKHNGDFEKLAVKYVNDLIYYNKTVEKINKIIKSKYSVSIPHLITRKPENRNKDIKAS